MAVLDQVVRGDLSEDLNDKIIQHSFLTFFVCLVHLLLFLIVLFVLRRNPLGILNLVCVKGIVDGAEEAGRRSRWGR